MTADPPAPRAAVVLVAAGAGTRVGGPVTKVLLPLLGTPVLAWSLRTACSLPYVDRVVVVVREQDVDAVAKLVAEELRHDQEVALVTGGATRHASEQRGLAVLRADVEAGAARRGRGPRRAPGRWPTPRCSTRWSAPRTPTAAPYRCGRSAAWWTATGCGT